MYKSVRTNLRAFTLSWCELCKSKYLVYPIYFLMVHIELYKSFADPGGAAGARPPNRIQFFHFRICFHQKAPTSEAGTPPMAQHPPNGKSWICHCKYTRFPRNLAHGLYVGKGPYLVKSLAHYISPWAYKWGIRKQN